MSAPRPAPDSPDSHALALRLLLALPGEAEPRRALRAGLALLRDEFHLDAITLETPDPQTPERWLELVGDGAALPGPVDPEDPEKTVVTWVFESGGSPFARLRFEDPAGRLRGLDAAPLRALMSLQVQSALRGLELAQRSLFVRCTEHLVSRLGEGAEEPELYDTLTRCLTEILPVDCAVVYTISEDRGCLIPWALSDRRQGPLDPPHAPSDLVLDLAAEPRLAEIVRAGRTVHVEDFRTTRLPEAWHRMAELQRVRSALAFPLGDTRSPWGLVLLGREGAGPVLSPLDTELARLLLQHLAPLLQNARVMRQLQTSVASLQTLLEAGRDISAVLDLWEIPRRIAIKGVEVTGSDECLVALLAADGQTLSPLFALSPAEEELLRWRGRIDAGIPGAAAATRRAICRNRATPEEASALGFQRLGSILAVPLTYADDLLGLLVFFRGGTREYSDLDVTMATVFGTQAAISLENSRLFQSETAERTRLATMIEQLEEGVLLCGVDGVIQRVNPAGRRWLGCPEDPRQSSLFELLRQQRRPELAEALRGLETGAARHLAQEFTSGGRVDLVSASVIPGRETPFGGFVLLIRDVTALKTMERRLIVAGRMSAVGQLASGVAHEFNNLIAAVSGYAQLMRDTDDPKIRRKGVEIILSSSERARQLTHNLLTFSRERGDRFEAVDLNALVENTLQLVEVQWRGEGIAVQRELAALPMTWVQPGPLQEALLNLLTNARHAIQERDGSGGRITLATRLRDDEIVLEVVDDGVGIPAEDLPRLFDPFFTTKGPLGGRATPGMGLGLFTVYNVVTGAGGRVEVTSEPGMGASFRVHLPVRAARPLSRAA